MFLNDLGLSTGRTFQRVNRFLSDSYGFTIGSGVSGLELSRITRQINEEIDQLKSSGQLAQTSEEISKRLLILEGLKTLGCQYAQADDPETLESVVCDLVSALVDRFASSECSEQCFEESLIDAMETYRGSSYTYPEDEVEHMVRARAIDRLEEELLGVISGDPDGAGQISVTPADAGCEKDEEFGEFVMSEKVSMIKNLRRVVESQVSQAQVMMAAKGFAQELQEMVEKVGRLQNEDLPPVTDQMRETYGTESASTFQTQIYGALQTVMDSLYTAKGQIDDAVESLATTGRVGARSDMDVDLGSGTDLEAQGVGDVGSGEGVEAEPDLELSNLDLEEPAGGDVGRERKNESVERLERRIDEMRRMLARARTIREKSGR